MSKAIRATIELVKASEVDKILSYDASNHSSSQKDYISANRLSCYILTNTWLMCIREYSPYGWVYVKDALLRSGTIEVIRRAQTSADEIIHGQSITDPVFRMIRVDVSTNFNKVGVPLNPDYNIGKDDVATALFLLRYPKRYSPLRADRLNSETIQNFIATQNRVKLLQRRGYSTFILERVRDTINTLVDWDSLVEEWESLDPTDLIFTPGVGFDSSAQLMSKLEALVRGHADSLYPIFGIPFACHAEGNEVEYWGFGLRTREPRYTYPVHESRLICVPKNYKSARTIAPEDTFRQARARKLFAIADRYCPGMVRLHDQSQNQNLALAGSLDGHLGTIDLHAASDSVSITLLRDLFPLRAMRVLETVLPTHFSVNGERRFLYAAATMGNAMTFWIESIVFCGIALAAVNYCCEFTQKTGDVSVYGDDIIVPTDAAQTVIEWLEALGFIVNKDKTFVDWSLPYRESCGVEYYHGINLSSMYFPRFSLEGTLEPKVNFSSKARKNGFTGEVQDSLAAAISLQHKLFLTCTPASLLLSELIKEAFPKMTTSTPDEGYQDLWSYESTPVRMGAPTGEIINGHLQKSRSEVFVREYHYTPVASYPNTPRNALWMAYEYTTFLKHGPYYTDSFFKLLGISSVRTSVEEASNPSEIRWILTCNK
jgi:hypothetical protein